MARRGDNMAARVAMAAILLAGCAGALLLGVSPSWDWVLSPASAMQPTDATRTLDAAVPSPGVAGLAERAELRSPARGWCDVPVGTRLLYQYHRSMSPLAASEVELRLESLTAELGVEILELSGDFAVAALEWHPLGQETPEEHLHEVRIRLLRAGGIEVPEASERHPTVVAAARCLAMGIHRIDEPWTVEDTAAIGGHAVEWVARSRGLEGFDVERRVLRDLRVDAESAHVPHTASSFATATVDRRGWPVRVEWVERTPIPLPAGGALAIETRTCIKLRELPRGP